MNMKPQPQTTRPRRGENNRRTLLITGGKLGCMPIALTFVDYLSILNRRARRFEQLQPETIRFIEEVEARCRRARITYRNAISFSEHH